MARLASIASAGYFATPPRVTAWLTNHVLPEFGGTDRTIRLLDPCSGDGRPAARIADAIGAQSYGIELNADRARQSREVLDNVLGEISTLNGVRLAHHAWSLLFLNPPYDYSEDKQRLEHEFLIRCTEALVPGGILMFLIPQRRLVTSARYLASHYEHRRVYRFPLPEYNAFRQVVVLARRRSHAVSDPEAQTLLEHYSDLDVALPEIPEVPREAYEVPSVPSAEPLFASLRFDPGVAAEEAARNGVFARSDFAELVWPSDELTDRPLMPFTEGHRALLIAAGLVNNRVLEHDDSRILLKGRANKQVVLDEEQTDEEKEVTREKLRISLMKLDLATGLFERIDSGQANRDGDAAQPGELQLQDFLNEWGTPLENAVLEMYPPRYTSALRETLGYDMGLLLRRPLGAQADAIRALAMALEIHRGCQLVGTMGVGKSLVAAAAAWFAGMHRPIVMCPPQLPKKWRREVQGDGTPAHPPLYPGAKAVIVKSIRDIEQLRACSDPNEVVFTILSRERAKLGYAWKNATIRRRAAVKDESKRTVIREVYCCPDCFAPVVDDEGVPLGRLELDPSDGNKRARRLQCQAVRTVYHGRKNDGTPAELQVRACGAALWQADVDGPQRFPLADYIRQQMPGYFDVLIADECFPAGTPISTPGGPVPIERIRVGDEVVSWDGSRSVQKMVTRVIRKRLRQSLVRVSHTSGDFECTPNHKIYTLNRGYVQASDLTAADSLMLLERPNIASNREVLPSLRSGVYDLGASSAGAGLLWSGVRVDRERLEITGAEAFEAARDGISAMRVLPDGISATSEQNAALLQPKMLNAEPLDNDRPVGPHTCQSPCEDARTNSGFGCTHGTPEQRRWSPRAVECLETRSNVQWDSRWQWFAYQSAAAFGRDIGMAGGVAHPDGTAILAICSSGHRKPSLALSHRGRRRQPSHQQATEPRPTQGDDSRRSGVVAAAILELGDRHQPAVGPVPSGHCCPSRVLAVEPIPSNDVFVYDLEVENTHCYFARNVLVSNCHELKGRATAQGLAAASLAEACGRSLALTGTMLGGYSSTVFHIAYRFNPAVRREFAHNDEKKWVRRFGFIERTTFKENEDSDLYEEGRQSKRKTYRSPIDRERPGIMPPILFQFVPNTVFLRLGDVARDLPPYHEYVETIDLDTEEVMANDPDGNPVVMISQRDAYAKMASDLEQEVDRLLQLGSKKLLGQYLQTLLSWSDNCVVAEEVWSMVKGHRVLIAHAPAMPGDRLYPKEKRLIEIVRQSKAEGRRALVYITHTDTRDLSPRVRWVLGEAGFKVAVLKSDTVKPEDREEWIAEQVARGVDVLIANPKLVQTGLDLIDFPDIVWLELDYSTYVTRQASRRSWRIGQTQPVRVFYLCYRYTLQEQALALCAAKMRASLMLEGELASEGLSALGGDDIDMYLTLARQFLHPEHHDARTLEVLFAEAREAELKADSVMGDPNWAKQAVPLAQFAPPPAPVVARFDVAGFSRKHKQQISDGQLTLTLF